MIFRKILEDIVQEAGGGLAGLVIGRDGIALEIYERDGSDGGVDIQALGVELVTLAGETSRVSRVLGAEGFEELSLILPGHIALMRQINPEYFLVILIRRDGNFGKARYLMRRETPRLQKEL